MKHYILLVLSTLLILSLTACGAGDVGRSEYNSSTESVESRSKEFNIDDVNFDKYEDNLEGLIQCMKDQDFISGNATDMSEQFIGAKQGYSYQFIYEKSNVSVELYEFDLNNLNDTAKSVIEQVNQQDQFVIQGLTVPAVMSNSGKYLMVYTFNPNNEENQQRQSDVENLLKVFKT